MIPIADNIPTHKKPIINTSLIIINVIVFIYELTLSPNELTKFFREYGFLPSDLLQLKVHKIFTAMFIHGNIFHILGNMLFLYVFGDNVEDALGRVRYLVLYFVSGIGAAVLQAGVTLLFGGVDIPMIGASGAISGVIAAYVKLYPHAKIITIIPPFWFAFVLPAWFFVGYWFLIQLMFAIAIPPTVGGIAWYAHIGGFITGWYLVDLLYPKHRPKLVHYSILR